MVAPNSRISFDTPGAAGDPVEDTPRIVRIGRTEADQDSIGLGDLLLSCGHGAFVFAGLLAAWYVLWRIAAIAVADAGGW